MKVLGKILFVVGSILFLSTGCSVEMPDSNLTTLFFSAIASLVVAFVGYRLAGMNKWEE